MTKQVQRRRGTSTQHTSFTGAEGEISVNTTNKSIHVHDGVTAGGVEAARADMTNVSDANLNARLNGNTLSSLTITSADINGGTIDGTVIGGSSAAAGTFTTLDVIGNIKIGDGGAVYSSQNITISADPENDNAASAINFNVDGTEVADLNNGGYLRFNKSGFAGGGICNQQNEFALNLAGGTNAGNSGVNLAISGPSHVAGNAGVQWRDGTTVIGGWLRSGDYHYFNTGGSESMRITSTGRVGIGTSTPNAILSIDVNGAANRAIEIYNSDTALNDAEVVHSLRFTQNDASNPNTTHASIETVTSGTLGLLNMVFKARNNTEYMRIDTSGNVGIGTSAPTHLFTVGEDNSNNPGKISIGRGGLEEANIFFTRAGVNDAEITYNADEDLFIKNNFAAGDVVYSNNLGAHIFNTGSAGVSEAMRITSTGNVGIGTSSPQRALHIANTEPTLVLQETDQATDESRWRIYMTGSDLLITTANDAFSAAESAYRIARGDGIAVSAHLWYTDNNERMRITSAGSVGINETIPDYKLDVNGTFGFTPGASVTPVDNGDVVFELTNNTTLTVKAKGSDGVVRSATLTLA